MVEVPQEDGGGTRLLLEQDSQQLCFWSAPLKCCRFPDLRSGRLSGRAGGSHLTQLRARAALLKHSLLLGVCGR